MVENLYARIGTQAPNLVFAGHTDVVPPGDEKAWTHPPFAGDSDGSRALRPRRGRHEGRHRLRARRRARSSRRQRRQAGKGSISFLITGDEEGIAVNGTPKLLKWAAEHGEKFDHCMLGEPSNVEALGDTIKIGRRGSLNGHLIVTGTAGPRRLSRARGEPDPRAGDADRGAAGRAARQRHRAFPAVASGIHLGRRRQQDRQPHSRRGARALQHPLQRHAHARFAEGADRSSAPRKPPAARSSSPSNGSRRTPACSSPRRARSPNWSPRRSRKSPAASRICRPRGGTSDARFITHHCPVVEFGLVGQTMHQVDERVPIADLRALTAIYRKIIDRYFA